MKDFTIIFVQYLNKLPSVFSNNFVFEIFTMNDVCFFF